MVYFTDYRMLLWFGFIPCLLALFVLFKYMPEKKHQDSNELVTATTKTKPDTRIRMSDFKQLSFRYWSLILVATLFMCARFNDCFLILRLDQIGAPVWLSASTIGMFNVISSLCCLPIGHLSDRIDRSKMLYFSFIALVLTNVCMLMDNLPMVLVGVVMWGAQRGTSQVLFSAIIADEAPRKIIGTAMGIFYLLTGVIAVFAGSIAGSVSQTSVRNAFYFGFAVSSIALVVLYIRNEMLNRRESIPTLVAEAS